MSSSDPFLDIDHIDGRVRERGAEVLHGRHAAESEWNVRISAARYIILEHRQGVNGVRVVLDTAVAKTALVLLNQKVTEMSKQEDLLL